MPCELKLGFRLDEGDLTVVAIYFSHYSWGFLGSVSAKSGTLSPSPRPKSDAVSVPSSLSSFPVDLLRPPATVEHSDRGK